MWACVFQDLDKKLTEAQRIANEALYRELPQPGVNASEVQAVETRVGARMQQAIGEMQTIAADAVSALRGQLTNIGSQLAAAQERSERAEKTIEAAGERLVARVQESIDGVSERITALDLRIATLEQPRPDADAPRIEALEASLESLRKQNAELHDLVRRRHARLRPESQDASRGHRNPRGPLWHRRTTWWSG